MPATTTDILEIHYMESGPPDGWPVVLTHGFPYSPSVYDNVAPKLVEVGARVIRPYIRGYGPTRFLSSDAIRSGQQAALASDLIALLDALGIQRAILAGFDWGGLASCTATALYPDRAAGMVCSGGYDVLDVEAGKIRTESPQLEKTMWYQYLFQNERGRQCLKLNRDEICGMLWKEWSPSFETPNGILETMTQAFDNDDFVDVVASHYRHAMGAFDGDNRYERLERKLSTKPKITVPSITIDGTEDPLKPGGTEQYTVGMFTAQHEHWKLKCGHSVPMEAPQAFADAVLTVRRWIVEAEK